MNDKFVFVSVLGTQLLGTLQPLMAFVELEGPVKSFFLLTSKLQPRAEALRDFVAAHGLGCAETIPCAASPQAPDYAPALIGKIAADAAQLNQRVCLNVDGGLNYLIAAIVPILEPYKPLYIQTSRDRAVILDCASGVWSRRPLPKALPVSELLELQGVTATPAGEMHKDRCVDMPFRKYAREQGISLPDNSLADVEIGGVVFDLVWNPGNNRLHFFKDWRFRIDDDKERLARERELAKWSKDRTRCGDIHDKSVTVLVWNAKSEQRLLENSGGKITVVNIAKGVNSGSDAEKLKNVLKVKLPRVRNAEWEEPEQAEFAPMQDNTLVTAIGDNFITTFLAIASHKPDHVILCHDFTNPDIVRVAKRLAEYAPLLGLKSVRLANLPIEGVHAARHLPEAAEPGARISVNITPGSKGQTMALSRWAHENGYATWSIYNAKRVCAALEPAPDRPDIPLDLWDPALVLKLLGREILDEGTDQARQENPEALDALLAFMRKLVSAGLDINDAFANGYLRAGEDSLKKKGENHLQLAFRGNKHGFRMPRSGLFEQLCARALANAGATHIRANLKLPWDEEIEKALPPKYFDGGRPHSWEVDVLAVFRGDLINLSAKSYPLLPKAKRDAVIKEKGGRMDSLEEACAEACNTGAYLGTFALSLVSDLGASKSPLEQKTTVVGWRELCQPEILADYIASLSRRKGTFGD